MAGRGRWGDMGVMTASFDVRKDIKMEFVA